MASYSATQAVAFLVIGTFCCLQVALVAAFEFETGDNSGWVVPPVNDTKFYNDWASEKRFRVGDTIRFKYKKDSVMEVSERDYKGCNSTRPTSFSNTGNTMVTLDRSGYFYFISGASGHCERGQRMIVKVMAQDQDSKASGNDTSSAASRPIALFHQALAFITLYLAFMCLVSYSSF